MEAEEVPLSVRQLSAGRWSGVRSVRAAASRLERRVFVRNPNCRMRTKLRGRMRSVNRRRNSLDDRVHLALFVAVSIVFPAKGDFLAVECLLNRLSDHV
jgi:hypothetical protein